MKQQQLVRTIYRTGLSLGSVLLVFLVSIFFLNRTSVGSQRFVWMINLWAVVWAVNFILILTLSFILARNLIKLFIEYHADRPGSRIKTKLVITLITFSLFPAVIMAFMAFGLINQNLRQWFSAPSEQLLDSSRQITRSYYEQSRAFRLSAAQSLAQWAGLVTHQPDRFRQLSSEYGFDGIVLLGQRGQVVYRDGRLFGENGRVVYRNGEWIEELDLQSGLEKAFQGENYYSLQTRINVEGLGLIDHGVVGIPVDYARSTRGVLFGHFLIPQSVTFHALQVEDAASKYEAIKGGVSQFRLNYFSILGLTTLAVVLGFLWLGTFIAKKITVPLEALAEGSRELAEGNLDHRVGVSAIDELGILVDSFNRMAAEIKQSRQKLEKANAEMGETNIRLDQRRHYIETILQNIATAVITIDETDVIRTVNEAALKMFQVERKGILNWPLREVADPNLYSEFQLLKKRARLYGTYRKEVTFKRGERQLYVAATITSNPVTVQDEKVEYLIVLDDLTELLKAEKFAAWQEVARRLAHEIKNPLTPIQLSAERVNKRFEKIATLHASSKEIGQFQKILGDAMRIIVTEAETLRALVEEFSRFARLPICKLAKVGLHQLIEETVMLYDGGLEKVDIRKFFDPRIGEVEIDREQLQRVFINLIDNSLDALAEAQVDRAILIRTKLNEGRQTFTIQFEDNGVGIAPEDYENLFLPYFSTKKKGTGLGLAIVRQIISEHNGFIRAEPNLPKGTRFVMELPANARGWKQVAPDGSAA